MTGLLVYATLFTTTGACAALVAVWWFQPRRFNTATHNIHRHATALVAHRPQLPPLLALHQHPTARTRTAAGVPVAMGTTR